MLSTMYPLIAALAAIFLAQFLKPVLCYGLTRKTNWSLIFASGGFPSSHTAGVSAVTLAVGLNDNFNSDLFAVTLVLALVISYDAMNVRYYAGQNIQITKQLIRDISDLSQIQLNDPIYFTKMKEVLGHKMSEVVGGILLGVAVAVVLYLLVQR